MWPPLGNRFRQRSSYIETIGRTPNIAKHVFCYLKNIWCLNVIFFNSIQLGKLYGAYFAIFSAKNTFHRLILSLSCIMTAASYSLLERW